MWRNVREALMHRTSHGPQTDVPGGQPHQPASLVSLGVACPRREAVRTSATQSIASCPITPATGSHIPTQSGFLVSKHRSLPGATQGPTCRRRADWGRAGRTNTNGEWLWCSTDPAESAGPASPAGRGPESKQGDHPTRIYVDSQGMIPRSSERPES